MARLLAEYPDLPDDVLLKYLAICADELAALHKTKAQDLSAQWNKHWSAWEASTATSAAARNQEAEHAARLETDEVFADSGNIAAITAEIKLIETVLGSRR